MCCVLLRLAGDEPVVDADLPIDVLATVAASLRVQGRGDSFEGAREQGMETRTAGQTLRKQGGADLTSAFGRAVVERGRHRFDIHIESSTFREDPVGAAMQCTGLLRRCALSCAQLVLQKTHRIDLACHAIDRVLIFGHCAGKPDGWRGGTGRCPFGLHRKVLATFDDSG